MSAAHHGGELPDDHHIERRKEGAIMTDEQAVREILEDCAKGRDVGNKMVYHAPSRSFRPSSYYDDPDETIRLTNEDTQLFLPGGRS